MGWKRVVLTGLVIVDLVAVNAAVGYWYYTQKFSVKEAVNEKETLLTETPVTKLDECGEACKQYIDTRIAESAGPSAQPKVTLTPVPTEKVVVRMPSPTTKPKTRSVQYLTIPGNGSTMLNVWENIGGTEFYFDKADYPGLVTVYFEASMRLFNGNGTAFVQLYDATHGVGVQGSDVQTSNQANTLVTSGEVTFWAGKNLIRVQARSLTADTAIYNSGRLKLILEN